MIRRVCSHFSSGLFIPRSLFEKATKKSDRERHLVHGRFPANMFESVDVVEFRGFESPEGVVRAKEVEIRVIVRCESANGPPYLGGIATWRELKRDRDMVESFCEL